MGGLSKVLKVITKRPKKSVMQEAQQGRKHAERGKQKTEQVAKRVLTYKQKRPFHSLNWEPETSLEDGLVKTINYFKKII